MRTRAERRHFEEARTERAKDILIRGGWAYGRAAAFLDVKAKKFSRSRFGCNCGLCRNPRKQYRGKNSAALTFAERRVEADE